MSQKRIGIIISYLNLAVGMVVNIFLTPYLIRALGDVDYSIYKVMQSFAGPLAMFHLGISTIVTRNIVKHRTSEAYTDKEKQNTYALAIISSVIMAICAFAVSIGMYYLIPSVYSETYSGESVVLGQRIFMFFALSSVLHMLTDAFSGCLIGHERFAVSSSISLLKTLSRCILIVILLQCGMGAVSVALVDFVVSAVILLFSVLYATTVLHEIPKLYYWDKRQIIEIVSFGVALLLQAFVNQVNNNVDTMILGRYIDEKSIITMYSSALAIYAIYNSLISVLFGYFLPQATQLITKNATGKELTDFVIRPGRFQAMIAVACICGFALFGRNFISIWIGSKYLDAYYVTLMLMIPVTIPLVENAAISLLDASLKRVYRSIVLVIMAVLNIIVSIILVSFLGFWGAAIGTVASLIVGHGVLLNIYYAKTFSLQIGRMFFSIFKGILPAGILTSLICVPIAILLPNTLMMFVVKCLVFVIIYALFLWILGINQEEKSIIQGILKKVSPIRRK